VQKICHIEFFGHFEFLRKKKSIKKLKISQNLINLKKIVKTSNLQVLNDKNVLASILNLGAILKFHDWQQFLI
jgi:hypothetical protein